jgi:predicted amidohydrolase YtcJ
MTDLILKNADIVTMDPLLPRASALAVKGRLISAVGRTQEIMAMKQARTAVLDLKGNTLCPGFIDAHLHFRALAESFMVIGLKPQSGIRSIRDINRRIEEETKKNPKGRWIRAAGYDEVYLEEHRHPDRRDLDLISPEHPVKLTHRSTYAHVLNSKGLAAVGIDRYADDPDGGIIERDIETGEPTGVLFGMGTYLHQRIPELCGEELRKGAGAANRQLLSFGITSFQDASSRNEEERLKWMLRLKKDGILAPRPRMIMGLEWFNRHLEKGCFHGFNPCQVPVSGIKIVIDETTGKLYPGQEELNEIISSVHKAGQQAVVHAIEDTAIEAALVAFENALTRHPRRDHRHRIEHCSVCPTDLCKKIATLGIMVVTHPAFVYYSGDRYLKTVSKRQREFLYPISSLMKAGVSVAAASDGPIVRADPISGISGAVTRLTRLGKILPGGRGISPYDALAMYTIMAAKTGFEEALKGSIGNGKYADFAVLSANPTKVKPNDIKDIQVEMTLIGGKMAWRRQQGGQ